MLFDAKLAALGGRINLASVASQGEVVPTDADLSLSQVTQRGLITTHNFDINTNWIDSGSIFIRGGLFELKGSSVASQTLGEKNAGIIDIQVDKLLVLQGSQISSSTFSTGNAGSIFVKADTVEGISGSIDTSSFSNILAKAGNAGNITIQARQVNLFDGAQINSFTNGSGQGGTIHLQISDTLIASGHDAINGKVSSGIFTVSMNEKMEKAGNAGNIEIEARQIILTNRGLLYSSTYGTGQGGFITLKVTEDLTLAGMDKEGIGGAGVFADSLGTMPQAGNGGQITIQARQINLADGARIGSMTIGTGQGGTIHLHVSDTLTASGQDAYGIFSGISADSLNQKLENAGNAGNIEIESRQIVLTHGGQISSGSNNAGGGNITIITPNLLYLQQGQITTSVSGGKGDSGNINIASPVFLVLDKAKIVAQADEGKGGNITITASHRVSSKPESNNVIDATSRKNISGKVVIKAQEEEVGGTLTILPATLKNYNIIKKRCTTEKIADRKKRSKFVKTGRGGVSDAPTQLRSGSVMDVTKEQLW